LAGRLRASRLRKGLAAQSDSLHAPLPAKSSPTFACPAQCTIVVNLHHAYRRPEFRDGEYAALHSGPSATADIEGVLIHGAQGVRSLSVLPAART